MLILFFSVACLPAVSQDNSSIQDLFKKLETAKDTGKANIFLALSMAYKYREDMLDSTRYFANEALKLSVEIGYDIGIAGAYNDLGIVYANYRDYDKALEMYFKAIPVYERLKSYRNLAKAFGNVANVYADQDKYTPALSNLSQGLSYARQLKDTFLIAAIYANISMNYDLLHKSRETYATIDTGMSLIKTYLSAPNRTGGDSVQILRVRQFMLKNKASRLAAEGSLPEALAILDEIWEQVKNKKGVAEKTEILERTADIYNRQKKYTQALEYAARVSALLKQDSLPNEYKDMYKIESDAYLGLKQYDKAFNSYLHFKEISDTLFSQEKMAFSDNLQIKYETEKKDRQIKQFEKEQLSQKIITALSVVAFVAALLLLFFVYRSKNLQGKIFSQKEELVSKEKELKNKETEKKINELEQMALRAQMNPHFIFNSLHSVQQFIINKDIQTTNKYLAAFARLMRQTLDNSSRHLIPLEDEISYLDSYLSLEQIRTNGKFDFSFHIGENINAQEVNIPNMVLQPFVENSIRHGVRHLTDKKGEINITVTGGNNQLLCIIEDNGVGRKNATAYNAGDQKQYQSKGISITMKRIETINKLYDINITATIEDIVDEKLQPAGTRVKIEFPLNFI